MKYGNNKYEDIKIAYIGGGSRGWAWGFMSDLAVCEDMCGTVYLYDIDLEAAKKNEKIGNGIKDIEGCKSQWKYKDESSQNRRQHPDHRRERNRKRDVSQRDTSFISPKFPSNAWH